MSKDLHTISEIVQEGLAILDDHAKQWDAMFPRMPLTKLEKLQNRFRRLVGMRLILGAFIRQSTTPIGYTINIRKPRRYTEPS